MTARGSIPALLLCTLNALCGGSAMPVHPLRVACLERGSESTPPLPATRDGSYPRELARLLGEGYEVRSFPLMVPEQGEMQGNVDPRGTALGAWKPDIVLVAPGDVDSSLTRGKPGSLTSDALAHVVTGLGALSSKPRIILLLPPPSFPASHQADSLLLVGTIQRIRSVAYGARCEVVDLHSLFLGNDEKGFGLPCASPVAPALIAGRLGEIITTEEVPGIDVSRVSSGTAARSSYYGYECWSFTFEGREARIVCPKRTARGSPWIRRARFWGHEPQTEIALLERGFHVAYCDVAELFGNEEALGIWDRFYRALTGAGLGKKTVLEGLSRGGMYIYR
ncbi:MAG TPA: G-D-S-L family lipolytic protein, partial [Bacteroidota bacterium]|nr:G-D-S-L family lipolytic protein [Bacteroidota bacterium]